MQLLTMLEKYQPIFIDGKINENDLSDEYQ